MPHHPITRDLTALLAGTILLGAPAAAAEETIPLISWASAPFWAPPAGPHPPESSEMHAARQVLAASATPLPFVALPPCRLVDTRGGAPLGGGFLPPATVRSYTLAGVCGLPANAQAVSVNATVVKPTGPGFLTLWPEGGAFPPVSTLNFVGGDIVANAAIVPLSTAGALSMALGGSGGDVVLDTNGYYAPVGTVTSVNAKTGDVTLAPGSNVTIVPAGNTFTIGAGPLVSSLKGLTGAVDVAGTNGLSASAGSGTVTVTSNATPADVPGSIVSRDPAGSFGATTLTLSGDLALPASTSGAGRLTQNGEPLLHTYGASNNNLFVGGSAGNFTMTGNGLNTGVGKACLSANTSGAFNTALGAGALQNNTEGLANTAAGNGALFTNARGNYNTAIGQSSLANNVAGSENTAVGTYSLAITTGNGNTAVGVSALATTTAGSGNTAVGASALLYNTGFENIAVGFNAGSSLTTGDGNIAIGHPGVAGESKTIRMGTPGNQTRAFVAGVRGVTTDNGDGIPVLVDSAGQLGTLSSSVRFKEDVRDMGDASARLLQLRPVTFRYRGRPDAPGERHYGLIAEEVDAVFPELVARSADGQVETVKYHELPAMLLNEIQRLTAAVRDLEARLARAETELQQAR